MILGYVTKIDREDVKSMCGKHWRSLVEQK